MDRYLVFSGGLHALAALVLVACLAAPAKKAAATYTIDFIGTGKVVATTGQEAAPKTGVQVPQPAPQAVAKPEPPAPAPAKKAYAAKTEIAEKPKPQKTNVKEEPLAAPSVLDDAETEATAKPAEGEDGAQENAFGGGNIQTDFANFPYPWYITQVRNSLWIEWEKRRPAGSTLGTLVSFAIARDGKVRDLKIDKKSGDETFDFAATSAVINAGPFAPLPMYYEKDELTVTVEFKQET
ncbi:MAG: TonB family protein [Elusimicrobiaceae bacterium]|nr:TonB family protein [Elusimicrobiaceae bacterium]